MVGWRRGKCENYMGIVANIKNWKNGDTGNSGSGSSLASTSSAQTASGVAIPMLGHEQQEQVAVGKQIGRAHV